MRTDGKSPLEGDADESVRCRLQTLSDVALVRALESAEHFDIQAAVKGSEGDDGRVVILQGRRGEILNYCKYLQAIEHVCTKLALPVAER